MKGGPLILMIVGFTLYIASLLILLGSWLYEQDMLEMCETRGQIVVGQTIVKCEVLEYEQNTTYIYTTGYTKHYTMLFPACRRNFSNTSSGVWCSDFMLDLYIIFRIIMMKCDQCGKELSKNRKRFCSNKCKDRYHNIHNPRGYYKDMEDLEDEHPFSSEGLGQWQ